MTEIYCKRQKIKSLPTPLLSAFSVPGACCREFQCRFLPLAASTGRCRIGEPSGLCFLFARRTMYTKTELWSSFSTRSIYGGAHPGDVYRMWAQPAYVSHTDNSTNHHQGSYNQHSDLIHSEPIYSDPTYSEPVDTDPQADHCKDIHPHDRCQS